MAKKLDTQSSGIHDGHRERMQSRFRETGLSGFQQHELLEMLLGYALPRKDTNPIAHELMRRFHSLSGVLEADIEELQQVKGIGLYAATFLKFLPELLRAYRLDKVREDTSLDTMDKITFYVKERLFGLQEEQILLICLDETLHIKHAEILAIGNSQEVHITKQMVAQLAIRMRCQNVILAHNHPNARAEASYVDVFTTDAVRKTLSELGITLVDHIVVGKNGDVVSMRHMLAWE